MNSSISSSKKLNANRAIVLLLTMILGYFGALEIATRTIVPRLSQIQRQNSEDYKAALALRPTTPGGSKTVLIVGNSLLRAGVDRERLRAAIAPSYSVSLFPIESATYWDWYFGLRRFFAEGSRPAAVVLCLDTEQLISDATNGERFAHYMMQPSDLSEVVRTARLDTTTASDYFFARWSSWLGGRWEIRNWILGRWIPDAPLLIESLVPKQKSTPLSTDEVTQRAVRRLIRLRKLVEANGARFLFFIPAPGRIDDPAVKIQATAEQAGIPVLLPYRPGEMPREAFSSDGIHLNPYGAGLHTERLTPVLYRALSAVDGPVTVSRSSDRPELAVAISATNPSPGR